MNALYTIIYKGAAIFYYYANTHTLTYSLSHTHAHTPTHVCAHSRTHTHPHSHAHTHAHAHVYVILRYMSAAAEALYYVTRDIDYAISLRNCGPGLRDFSGVCAGVRSCVRALVV